MAQPQAWHRVEAATDDVEWYLEFYCKPEDYFPKKYNTNPFHSEVLEAMQTVQPCKVLDLGCGQGRNALFLVQHGFDVTAVDQNELSLEILQSIVEQEDLELPVGLYDINSASIGQTYDFIVSTVVLMFLQADRIPAIIKNMQEQTSIGGYNLIVCAMDTEDYPCSVNFHSLLKKENWQITTRIGNWLNTMKIPGISTVAMKMAIVSNYALQQCWLKKV